MSRKSQLPFLRQTCFGFLAMLALATWISAQPPGGPGRGGPGRGGPPRGGPPGGGGPESTVDRLKRADANGDGHIVADEIPERVRPFVVDRAKRAGFSLDKPVKIETLASALDGIREEERRRDDDDDDRRSSKSDDDETLVPGFGIDEDLPEVPGFGILDDEEGSGSQVKSSGVPIEDRYGSRVVGYVDGILRRYDQDRNGQLEESEWRRARWRSPPEPSDTNNDRILSREELLKRVSGYSEFRDSSGGSSRGSSGGGSSSEDRQKYKDYAKGLLRRYDENKNGVLEKNEWGRMSSYHRGADANDDDVITADELADRLASYGKEKSSRSSGGGTYRSSRQEKGESYTVQGERLDDGRQTYRAKTATERLPKGLPDWFIRNDANGDGQIQMSEFAVSWSDDKLAEFQSHDANGDGIITAKECQGADDSSRSKSTRSSSSRYRRR